MAQLRLIAVLFVPAIFYITLIDSAAVRSEDFSEYLERVVREGDPEKMRIERAIETGGERFSRHICYNQPCGWAVYKQFTRQVETFITNTCDCPDKTYKCVRTDDDLSVSAYVYRCRQNTTAEDIEAPEDAD